MGARLPSNPTLLRRANLGAYVAFCYSKGCAEPRVPSHRIPQRSKTSFGHISSFYAGYGISSISGSAIFRRIGPLALESSIASVSRLGLREPRPPKLGPHLKMWRRAVNSRLFLSGRMLSEDAKNLWPVNDSTLLIG